MVEHCRRDQWSPSDLDWSVKPRSMSRADEEAVVQLFTDMAGIERLAGGGVRLREAFKRFQQLGAKPGVRERPFGRFMMNLQDLYHDPVIGPLFGGVLARVSGVSDRFLQRLNDESELAAAAAKSYEDLAEEVLGVKREVS